MMYFLLGASTSWVSGNEVADKKSTKREVDVKVPVGAKEEANSILKKHVLNKWQVSWNNSSTGRWCYYTDSGGYISHGRRTGEGCLG